MTRVKEAGFDYLAMSLPIGDADYSKWVTATQNALDLLIQHGNTPKVGSFRGYDGIWCGGAFAGQRDDSAYIHVAGAWAARLWSLVHHPRAHYSRLDLQATVEMEHFDSSYSKEIYALAQAHNASRPERQRRKLRYMEGSDGGSTVYIGSRTSEHYCRLYNKEAQSSDEFYRHCWRYEVELHNDSATDAARYVAEGLRNQARACASTVWHYYEARGVPPAWDREGEENAVLPRASPRSDLARKLAWLTEQVGPTVELLMQHMPATIVFQALRLGTQAERLPVENATNGEDG